MSASEQITQIFEWQGSEEAFMAATRSFTQGELIPPFQPIYFNKPTRYGIHVHQVASFGIDNIFYHPILALDREGNWVPRREVSAQKFIIRRAEQNLLRVGRIYAGVNHNATGPELVEMLEMPIRTGLVIRSLKSQQFQCGGRMEFDYYTQG